MHRNFEEGGTDLSGARGSFVGGSGRSGESGSSVGEGLSGEVEWSQTVNVQLKCLVFIPSASEERSGLLVALVDASCLAGIAEGGSRTPEPREDAVGGRWSGSLISRRRETEGPEDDLPWGCRLGAGGGNADPSRPAVPRSLRPRSGVVGNLEVASLASSFRAWFGVDEIGVDK